MTPPDDAALAGLSDAARAVVAAMLDRMAPLDPRRTADMLAIGSALLDIRNALPGRAFEPWLRTHLSRFARRSALNYMRAAARFGADPDAVAHLRPTAVVRLSAPGLPEAEREALFDLARKGSTLSAAGVARRGAEARSRAVADADTTARSKRRRADARDWERRHRAELAASDASARTLAGQRAARHIASRIAAPAWLYQALAVCDPAELRDLLIAEWAESDLVAPSRAAPAPMTAKPANSQGVISLKRKSPGE